MPFTVVLSSIPCFAYQKAAPHICDLLLLPTLCVAQIASRLTIPMPFSTFIPLVSLALFATDAIATGLFVSSYNGSIFSLTLTLNYYQGLYKLTHQFTDNGCAPNATSLTLDEHNRLLYCVGEGTASVNGSLSSYSISANGFLNQQHKVKTIGGPVNAALYGNPNTTHGVGIAN